MEFAGIFVFILLVIMFYLLAKEKLRPGIILFTILTVLLVSGIIDADEMLSGFSNKGMLTVFILFFVSEGVRQTGALNIIISNLLPRKKGILPVLLLKMMVPVSALSSALNNTPVVIIFAPVIKKWAEKLRLPPSKFLIPLSYATIFGGMCTLIGTSTNLVVHGLMLENGLPGLEMFELAKAGVFMALAGLIYVAFVSPFLLPGKRKSHKEYETVKKEYYNNVIIPNTSPFIGKKIVNGHFPGHRDIFITVVERSNESLNAMSGETILQAGDKLVVLGGENIIERWQGGKDFYLLSDKGVLEVPQSSPRIWFAMGLTLLMVLGATFSDFIPKLNGNRIDMFFMAALVATLMFWTKIISAKNYTGAVNWDVLITIACAFGISKGVQNSGLADSIAGYMINSVKEIGPITVLAVIYLLTTIFTEIITNNAAVALMFPIALSAGEQMQVNPHPYFIAICFAASASFATPIGYQTNLIVQGIGEYKFKDFLRIGLPLNLIIFLMSVLLVPLF